MSEEAASPNEVPTGGRGTDSLWLPALLLLVLGAILAFRSWRPEEVTSDAQAASESGKSWSPSRRPEGEAVSLQIDYGNGVSHRWEALAFSAGMTVQTALEEASRFQPGIEVTYLGEGDRAFLTAINSLDNEGLDARNWIYSVNGNRGKKAFAIRELKAGDAVLWKFATYE